MTRSHRRPLSVAVVATSATFGGAESQIISLYRGLRERHGLEVTLIGDIIGWPEDLGARISIDAGPKLTRSVPLHRQIRGVLRTRLGVTSAVRGTRIDVFHMQYLREKLLLPRLLSRIAPVLWTEHGPLPTNFPPGALRLLRHQARYCDVVGVSDGTTLSLRAAGIRAGTVLNPLTRPPSVLDTRDGGSPLFVFAGRLHANKRVDLLLEAARLLPGARFAVAGDGPASGHLRSIAPSNVSFLGHLDDVTDLLGRADAVVIPSGQAAREGCPMVLLEARGLGVPVVVASDCHASREALSLGATLFEPSPPALAHALGAVRTEAARQPLDPDRIAERTSAAWIDGYFERLCDAADRAPAARATP